MHSLDPKLTLAIYIGASVVFLIAVLTIFFYGRSMKTKKAAQELKGRPPASVEEGILLASQKKDLDVR